MRYTIIIPVCNGETALPQCVSALLEQSCRDLEILLVDHGSTDATEMLCRGYEAAYPEQIRAIHLACTAEGPARNAGIREARGAYLLFADVETRLRPEALSALAETTDQTGADLVLTGRTEEARFALPERPELLLEQMDVRELVWKRQLFDDAYLRFPEEPGYDDLRLTRKALALSRVIVSVPEKLCTGCPEHREQPERELAVLDALDDIRGYFQRRGLLAHFGSQLTRLAAQQICLRARTVLANRENPAELAECIRYLDNRFPDWPQTAGRDTAKQLELIRQGRWTRLQMLFFLKRGA